MESIKVKVIARDPDPKCNCGNWLSHWRKYGKPSEPVCCPEFHCKGTDLIGVQVVEVNDDIWHRVVIDNIWHSHEIGVLPLCKEHAKEGAVIDLIYTCKPVLANLCNASSSH